MRTSIKYIVGDVTDPRLSIDQFSRPIIIPHVVNNKGIMGGGVAKALYTKWPQVKSDYVERNMRYGLDMGSLIRSYVDGLPLPLDVISMVAQDAPGVTQSLKAELVTATESRFPYEVKRPPIRYAALAESMRKAGCVSRSENASIHAPKFGSDLAGGDWSVIEQLILEVWVDQGLDVTIYQL